KNDRNKSSIQPFAATDSSNQTLKKGIRDSQVVQLKKDLAKLGFKVPGNGTNLYGTKTEKRLKNYRNIMGLSKLVQSITKLRKPLILTSILLFKKENDIKIRKN